ncbi:MAG: TorF family putative porin [Phycisphaeraceae bacterium]
MPIKFTTAILLAAAATLSATHARADDQAPQTIDEAPDGLELPGVSATITLDYVSQYFFRGYEQLDSDSGVVIQPGAEFSIPVIQDDAFSIDATIGTWGSIHTAGEGWPVTGAPGSGPSNPTSWFEQDVYASLDLETDTFDLSVGVIHYEFPNSASNVDTTELNVRLTLDDSAWFGDFAFNPYVLLAVEMQNNNVLLGRELSYLELGGAFEFDFESTDGTPLVLTVPIAVGLSLDDYYLDASLTEETFGFVSVGVFCTFPLSEATGSDAWLGAWDLVAGGTVYFLNSDVAGQVDNTDGSGDNIQFVAQVGISRTW